MVTVDVRARVEPALKRDASAVLKACGLDVSTAIRMFLRSVVESGGLPMAVPVPVPQPNAKTLAAIRKARSGKVTDTTLKVA